ncbi:MAG: hypothetical protein M3P11_04250 [Actinomycetota bacterium]|nr:hypothetical protein [Actinomycetota bacterium]
MNRRRRMIGGAVACVMLAAFLQVISAPPASATSCGVWRWPVKTLSDKARTKVDFTPKSVRIDRLRNLTAPTSLSTSTPRIKGVEFKTYRLKVQVREAKIEDDSDIHLVIASRTARRHTMIVEFPHPSCVDKPFKRHAMRAARSSMLNNCGSLSTSSFTKLKGNVTIIGVGFWDEKHGQTGVAPNGIELHPVLRFAGTCNKA